MNKRVADIVIDVLYEKGITDCFSVVGGGAMHLNNAFAIAKDRIRTVFCHHEQACSMAAEAYARYSGRMAAVCVTSGPGGTNAINGVQGAWVDSIPMVVISGHPRHATTVAATGLNIRTRGVQENDIISMVKGITKYAVYITDPECVRSELEKAMDIAMSGRRGPVWISIPLDVQGALIDVTENEKIDRYESGYDQTINDSVVVKQINRLETYLKESRRPCILTGSGIRSSACIEAYHEFTSQICIPIVGGALQADINCNGDELYYGMSGSVGPRCGNFILQSADLILVLGNSLSTKQTGFAQDRFAPDAKIVMVDAQPDEMNKPGLHIELKISADLSDFFSMVSTAGLRYQADKEWISFCDHLYKSLPADEIITGNMPFDGDDRVPELLFWHRLLPKAPEEAVFALGNSKSILGVLQLGIHHKDQRVLVNYNCGSMGDDLPEALGAYIGGAKEVYLITGDGCMMMNLQELQTLKHYGVKVKIVLFNNNGYGAIRKTCSRYFDGVYSGCDDESGISFPEFGKVAEAFGFPYMKCNAVKDIEASVDWLIGQDGACMLEVMESIDELDGPGLVSVMDANGEFRSPSLHEMTPPLSDELMSDLGRYINNR